MIKTQQAKIFIKNENDKEIFSITQKIFSILKIKDCFETIFKNNGSKTIDELEGIIKFEFKKFLVPLLLTTKIDELKQKKIVERYLEVCMSVVKETRDVIYNKFTSSSKIELELDTTLIGLISTLLNRDIYIISVKQRLPTENNIQGNIKNRKSILISSYKGKNFEYIGRLDQDKVITKNFYSNDPIIKKIYTFLFEKQKVSELYPDLVEYLPEKYRKEGYRKSCSRSPHRKNFFIKYKDEVKNFHNSDDEY